MVEEATEVDRQDILARIKTSRGDTVALLMEVATDEELETFHSSLLATDIVSLSWKAAAQKRDEDWADKQSKLGGMPQDEEQKSDEKEGSQQKSSDASAADAAKRKELMERLRKLVQATATLAKDAPAERLEAAIPKFEQAAIALRGPKS